MRIKLANQGSCKQVSHPVMCVNVRVFKGSGSVLIKMVQTLTVFDVSLVGYDGGLKNPNLDFEVKLISFSADSGSRYLKGNKHLKQNEMSGESQGCVSWNTDLSMRMQMATSV